MPKVTQALVMYGTTLVKADIMEELTLIMVLMAVRQTQIQLLIPMELAAVGLSLDHQTSVLDTKLK
jgi:hypothetical protein